MHEFLLVRTKNLSLTGHSLSKGNKYLYYFYMIAEQVFCSRGCETINDALESVLISWTNDSIINSYKKLPSECTILKISANSSDEAREIILNSHPEIFL